MKLLITGWSGFVGQAVSQQLKNKIDIVNLQSDLTDHRAVALEISQIKPDFVLHLAAKTEVEKSFYNQIAFSDVNYIGTVNLIESCCKLEKIPKFLFSSTMEVYGWQPISDEIFFGNIPEVLPVLDSAEPNPNAPYAVAKFACEKYIEYAHRAYGIDYVMLRQTNTYGRKDNNYFVTEQIIYQMLTNNNMCELGYRLPYRNFLYIDDLIDIWERCIFDFELVKNDIYTIGPNNVLSIETHAKNIANKLNWHGKIEWNKKPARPGEIYYLNSSAEKISKLLNWTHKISYDHGLDLTIEIWKKNLGK